MGTAHLAVDVAFGGLTGPILPLTVLVLGHGAGGDIDAADLLAVRDAALGVGVAVVRVRQPYRVAGRRAPAPARQLDLAFAAVLDGVARGLVAGLPAGPLLIAGGRSSGARVAARVGRAAGAHGLLALAFPLVPPGRPPATRVDELAAAGLPSLVVQGARDPFGSGAQVRAALSQLPGHDVSVIDVADADHAFRTRRSDPTTTAQSLKAVAAAVGPWLATRIRAG